MVRCVTVLARAPGDHAGMTRPLTDSDIAEILGHPSPAGRDALTEALVLALTKGVHAQAEALAMLWSLPVIQQSLADSPDAMRALAAQTRANHELASAWRLARRLDTGVA
jgi:hypothetical protein